jgi:hypothetical protein
MYIAKPSKKPANIRSPYFTYFTPNVRRSAGMSFFCTICCRSTKISAHNTFTQQRTPPCVCRHQLRTSGNNLKLFFENPRFSLQPSTACLIGTNGVNFAFTK